MKGARSNRRRCQQADLSQASPLLVLQESRHSDASARDARRSARPLPLHAVPRARAPPRWARRSRRVPRSAPSSRVGGTASSSSPPCPSTACSRSSSVRRRALRGFVAWFLPSIDLGTRRPGRRVRFLLRGGRHACCFAASEEEKRGSGIRRVGTIVIARQLIAALLPRFVHCRGTLHGSTTGPA